MKNYIVTFNEMSEEKQFSLLRENKNEVLEEASKSQYVEVRLEVAKDLETTSVMLEKMLEVEESEMVIEAIIGNQNFKRTKRNLIALSKCLNPRSREEIAGFKEMTTEILESWLEREEDEDVIRAIIRNPRFKRTDGNLKALSKCHDWRVRYKAADWGKLTNEILESWLEREENEVVIQAIIRNPSFEKTKGNLILLSKCRIDWIRKKVAGWKEMTTEILESWLEKEENEDVIRVIIRNPSLEKTEKTLILLSKSPYQWVREEVASWEEMTTEILESWLEREKDANVIWAIKTNLNSKKQDKTQQLLEAYEEFFNREK